MGINANKVPSAGFAREPMEPGTYPARLVQVIDFGLQAQREFKGEQKPPQFEIGLTWEFVDEFLKDKDGQPQADKPRWVSERMALHNLKSEKATSTKRYLVLDPTKKFGGDWAQLLNTPALVTVVNNTGKDGTVYDNVGNIAAMRSKDAEKCPALVNTPRLFDMDNPDVDLFLSFPPFIQEKIKGGLEYDGSKLAKLLGASGTPAKSEAKATAKVEEENPF